MDPIGRTVLADAQKPGRSFLHSLGTRLLKNQDSGCAGPSFFGMESEGVFSIRAMLKRLRIVRMRNLPWVSATI